MMPELSLNVLDVAENSVRAGASHVKIVIEADEAADKLSITIEDDGCGMTEEQIRRVEDPFFTTRTTRKVGLGVPFFKSAALAAGGDFSIESEPGVGTVVRAAFGLTHIDRMPLGDISATIHTLVVYNQQIDFYFEYRVNDKSFSLDTKELREVLGGVPFDVPEVSRYIMEYLRENKAEVDNGMVI